MSKILIIAEKPSLAKTIIKAVGGNGSFKDYYEDNKYVITSQFGHLLELKSIGDYTNNPDRDKKWILEDLPYFPKNFEYKVKNDSGVKARYKVIKELIKRNDINEIVNAGDPDREGEVLINIVIYRCFEELKIHKKITRIWLDPLTEEKVREELQNRKPIEQTQNLFEEGKTRAFLDWLYGINLTEYNTLKVGKIMNTGRVIIPLVKWVYDRDLQIENFKPEKYYEIETIINKDSKDIKLTFKDLKFKKEDSHKVNERLQEIQNKKIKVVNIENKEQSKEPKKLFSLSTLQSYMFKKEKFNISKTLQLVQNLYEKGYLTYPRTDTEYLSEEEKDKVKNILQLQNDDNLEFKDSKNIFNSLKVESHTAIIITTKTPNIDTLTEDEKKIYFTVRNRFYANFCKQKCIINKTIVTFELNNIKTKLTGLSIKQKGYLAYENDIENTYIPNFEFNEEFIPKFELKEKETTPPNHLSEADLISLCKNPFKDVNKKQEQDESTEEDFEEQNDDEEYKKILEGAMIGTEATRAIMIEKIKNVGYVEVVKNKLLITEYGKKFIETLISLNENLWKEKTAEMNMDLKKISKGQISSLEVIKKAQIELSNIFNQQTEIQKVSNTINKKILGKCPLCNGNIIENSKAYGCSNWKEKNCNFTIWKTISGKKISESNVKELLDKGITKTITGFKNKQEKTFSAKLKLNESNKIEFVFE